MSIKTYIKVCTVVGTLFVSYSCKDVVDTLPKGVLAEGLSSESITEGLVVAAYHGLSANVVDIRQAFVGPSSNWVMDVRSDDAYTGGEGAAVLEYAGLPQIERAQIFPSDADGDGLYVPLNKWRNNLIAIARVNQAIRSINELESETYPALERIGEMRLLRGHFHFDMKRTFDRIPYLMEVDDPTLIGNRTYSSEEVWDLIEADFQAAYDLLSTDQGERGRVNKYVAAAYLCKLYIEREQWDEAILMADEVLGGPYALLERFEDLSTIEAENGGKLYGLSSIPGQMPQDQTSPIMDGVIS